MRQQHQQQRPFFKQVSNWSLSGKNSKKVQVQLKRKNQAIIKKSNKWEIPVWISFDNTNLFSFQIYQES